MAHARCRSVRQSLLIMCVLYGIVQANLVGNELFHAAAVTNSTVVYGEQYVTAVNATFRTTKDEPCIRGDGTDILPRKDWCCDCWNTAPNVSRRTPPGINPVNSSYMCVRCVFGVCVCSVLSSPLRSVSVYLCTCAVCTVLITTILLVIFNVYLRSRAHRYSYFLSFL